MFRVVCFLQKMRLVKSGYEKKALIVIFPFEQREKIMGVEGRMLCLTNFNGRIEWAALFSERKRFGTEVAPEFSFYEEKYAQLNSCNFHHY